MGQTLFRAAQWTRATEMGKGKLEFTPLNEAILNSIGKFVEDFKNKHPDEAAVVFKSPLIWTSFLKLEDFLSNANLYKKTPTAKVVSVEMSKDRALLEIKQIRNKADRDHEIIVYTFAELGNILKITKENKLIEIRAALEANPDPIGRIFGEAFATVPDMKDQAQILLLMEKVINEEIAVLGNKDDEVQPKVVTGLNRTSLRLLLLLQQLDMQLMEQSFKKISSEVRLTPQSIDNEVTFLKAFTGKESKFKLIEDILYTSDIVTQFGCRAPLSRQFHGDICYLIITPIDRPTVYITCNTAGVFMNKGPKQNSMDLNYERNSEIYKDIRSLLKAQSPHFETMISSQDFINYVDTKRIQTRAMRTKSLSGLSIGARSIPYESFEDLGKLMPPRAATAAIKSQLGEKTTVVVKPGPIADRPVRGKSVTRLQEKRRLRGQSYWEKLNEMLTVTSESAIMEVGRTGDGAAVVVDSSEEEDSEVEAEDDLTGGMGEIAATDLPAEYWQVQKLFKYVRAGNQTGTAIALMCLRDYNLTSEFSQRAIMEMKGLDMLLNLLETKDTRCKVICKLLSPTGWENAIGEKCIVSKIASLKLLQEISKNKLMSKMIYRLSGIQSLVALLQEQSKQVTSLAAQNIAELATSKRVRNIVYDNNGVQLLVKLLKVDPAVFQLPLDVQLIKLEETRSAALALWRLAVSKKVRAAIRMAGGIPRLAMLLKNAKEGILAAVLGILQECLVDIPYQEAARREGMIIDIVKNLKSPNQELARLSAYAIFRCAEDTAIREMVRKYGGLNPLVNMLTNSECVKNKMLLVAITGALWKCAKSPAIGRILQDKNIIAILTPFLADPSNEEVLVNALGVIAECASDPKSLLDFQKAGGVKSLINMLNYTNKLLLKNCCKALKNCADEKKCLLDIEQYDGIRLMWSLLKQNDPELQATAAWAICPCIENLEESGELVRSFVGGLTLMVKLLNSDSEQVLCSVCATIAKICRDTESMAVLTDNGVVPLLARLSTTKNPILQRYVAEAISQISNWGNNRIMIGEEKAIAPMVEFLRGSDPLLLRHTCIALNNLSLDPANCVALHRAKAMPLLAKLVATTEDIVLQEAAATCLANIRHVGRVSDAANLAK
uniref:Armadillo repeat-containing protein 4 n=1 Tax=Strigamia maritima TaxID=126957 RepID=T1II95_STRMM